MLDLLADVKFMVPALVPEKYELISKSQWKVKKCFKLCNLSLNNVLICKIMKLHANYLSIFTSFYANPALLGTLFYTNSFKLTDNREF